MARRRGNTEVSLTAKPLTDDVYSRVRSLILSSRLRPGEKLVDRDLASHLGVSRTPIREALARLAMTGLVEARSRRGYYVAQYASEQMSELYEFRKILEVAAAGLAAQNAKPTHLRKMKRILLELEQLIMSPDSPDSPVKTVELDLQIHDVIAQASGNGSLQVAISNLMDKVIAFIWVDWVNVSTASTPEQIAASQREHQALLRSILKKDAQGAASLMGVHIDNARKGLEEMLRNRADMQSSMLSAR
jgi:DNA-binding GntR family transcriptional regulator